MLSRTLLGQSCPTEGSDESVTRTPDVMALQDRQRVDLETHLSPKMSQRDSFLVWKGAWVAVVTCFGDWIRVWELERPQTGRWVINQLFGLGGGAECANGPRLEGPRELGLGTGQHSLRGASQPSLRRVNCRVFLECSSYSALWGQKGVEFLNSI